MSGLLERRFPRDPVALTIFYDRYACHGLGWQTWLEAMKFHSYYPTFLSLIDGVCCFMCSLLQLRSF